MKHAIITICLILALSATRAFGADLLVPSQYPTIQAAVDAAKNSDTVIIAPGTYTGQGNRDINVNKYIAIQSQDGPETCIIDCNGNQNDQHYGFFMSTGTLAGITVTRGYSNRGGGAITFGSNGNPKITNCVLINNYGAWGGAISCGGGNLEITNCSLINNSTIDANAGTGGAIYCWNGSFLIANSTISGNSAGTGGGIYGSLNSNVIIKNCVISNNSAKYPSSSGGGGGVRCERGSLTVIGSQISRNSSSFGAGIYCNEPTAFLISDCNISDNNGVSKYEGAQTAGGAIYLEVSSNYYPNISTFQIMNTSITGNIVKGRYGQGGGLFIQTPGSSSYRHIMLTGCYIARNCVLAQSNDTLNGGGGIYSRYAVVSLFETQLLQNSAISGGGIYNEYSDIDMHRCRISGNSAVWGSAIASRTAGETALENCAITANGALDPAEECPVIQCDYDAALKIANCTIVNNTPPVLSSTENRFFSITNSIIYWNGRGPDSYWKFPPQSYFSVTYSDIQGGYTGGNPIPPGTPPRPTFNIDADPCFMQAGHWDTNGTTDTSDDFWVEGDYHLTAVSPCIDTGGVAFLTDNKDLAGKLRITGARLDMGAFEYQNTPPVAEAGPNQVAYAWIDGNSTVTLDGSASHDADGDKLTYLWRWTIDGNAFEANGVSPAIKLPVGTYKITLIVNDGFEDSQPDDVNITVVGPVEGRLWFLPRVINWQYGWPFVSAMIKLPPGITKEQIDAGYKLLLYPGSIEAQSQNVVQWGDGGNKQTAILAIFDRSAFTDAINTEDIVNLSVVGRFTTGRYFFGRDTVRIIKPHLFPKSPLCDK
jgi:hypothetical protein